MSGSAITCEHIISSLKTLGFSITRINENLVSLHKGTHYIRVSRGALDRDRETRMRAELPHIFTFFKKEINASKDVNLHRVRYWLASPSA
jgi:hypothetical protein